MAFNILKNISNNKSALVAYRVDFNMHKGQPSKGMFVMRITKNKNKFEEAQKYLNIYIDSVKANPELLSITRSKIYDKIIDVKYVAPLLRKVNVR